MFGTVWINPERMGGEPCFYGTRVPVQHLFDYLEGGEPLAEFLEGFPGVTREQAVAVLEMARRGLLAGLPRRRACCSTIALASGECGEHCIV